MSWGQRPSRSAQLWGLTPVLCLALFAGGCGTTIKEIRHHAEQPRLERLLEKILPYTKEPNRHYWVRVSEPVEHPVGLCILPQRHIYISESLMDKADDTIILVLLTHGVAHHRLHHH